MPNFLSEYDMVQAMVQRLRPSSPFLFLHRQCAGKFLGAVEGVHAEGGAVVEGGGAELGNLLREDVLPVAGGGHPCIEETDGEAGVGVGLDGRAIGLTAEYLFAIGFPGVDLLAGFVADAEGFGDVLWATEIKQNPAYPMELSLRVAKVSVETVRIVKGLSKLDI